MNGRTVEKCPVRRIETDRISSEINTVNSQYSQESLDCRPGIGHILCLTFGVTPPVVTHEKPLT